MNQRDNLDIDRVDHIDGTALVTTREESNVKVLHDMRKNLFNGKIGTDKYEGEEMRLHKDNVYLFPHNMPVAANSLEPLAMGNVDEYQPFYTFMYINFLHLLTVGLPVEAAVLGAYYRYLAVREGLVSHMFEPEVYHVLYSETVVLKAKQIADYIEEMGNRLGAGFIAIAAFGAMLAAVNDEYARADFGDAITIVAFHFRARGHHFLPGSQEVYARLWGKCLKGERSIGIAWDKFATVISHAIFPQILDDYWVTLVSSQKAAGAMMKRVDVAAAGSAIVSVLFATVRDIITVFPAFSSRVAEAYDYLAEVRTALERNRWGGSVNSQYYGVDRVRIDEARLGAIAASVRSIYQNLAEDSRALDSNALQRVAGNAPVTGAVLGIAANRATKDDRFSLIEITATETKLITK